VRLGCVILAHRDPDQLRLMLQVLAHDDVELYLHVDSRISVDAFPVEGVTLLPRHPTRWGGPELIDAVLDGLERAVADGCDYVILITGHGFPLRPIGQIVAFFSEHSSQSFGEYGPIEGQTRRRRTEFYAYTVRGRRELCIPFGEDTSMLGLKGRTLNEALRLRSLFKGRRRFPAYLEPYGGRFWWNLSREAAEYVLAFVAEHPDYRQYHEYAWCAEELFFCSILAQSGLDLVKDSLRYYTWGGTARSVTATPNDVPTMLASGALFAQKVDAATAAQLAELLQPRLTTE
jgi:Core-2/I-Branching enzyme